MSRFSTPGWSAFVFRRAAAFATYRARMWQPGRPVGAGVPGKAAGLCLVRESLYSSHVMARAAVARCDRWPGATGGPVDRWPGGRAPRGGREDAARRQRGSGGRGLVEDYRYTCTSRVETVKSVQFAWRAPGILPSRVTASGGGRRSPSGRDGWGTRRKDMPRGAYLPSMALAAATVTLAAGATLWGAPGPDGHNWCGWRTTSILAFHGPKR